MAEQTLWQRLTDWEKSPVYSYLKPLILLYHLRKKDRDVRRNAAFELCQKYAEKGKWKKVERLLEHNDNYIRRGAVWALDLFASNRNVNFPISYLVNSLGDKDEDVVLGAAEAFKYVALGKKPLEKDDINFAIPAIAHALENGNENIRDKTAWALWAAAENGTDIAEAIPALLNSLNDIAFPNIISAAGALTHQYVNRGELNKVKELLTHSNEVVAGGAAGALVHTTWGWHDIVHIIFPLINTPNVIVKENLTEFVGNYFKDRIEKIKIEDDSALREIKELTAMAMKIPDRKIRSWHIRQLAEITDGIHARMNPLDKREPMKWKLPQTKRQVVTERRKVKTDG